MTPEEHRILMETRELAEETHAMVRKMQRSQRASLVLRVLYWLIIIGLSIGAFWFIQPYVDSLKGSLGGLGGITGITGLE